MNIQNRHFLSKINGIGYNNNNIAEDGGDGDDGHNQLIESMMVMLNEKQSNQPLRTYPILNPDGLSQREIQKRYHDDPAGKEAWERRRQRLNKELEDLGIDPIANPIGENNQLGMTKQAGSMFPSGQMSKVLAEQLPLSPQMAGPSGRPGTHASKSIRPMGTGVGNDPPPSSDQQRLDELLAGWADNPNAMADLLALLGQWGANSPAPNLSNLPI